MRISDERRTDDRIPLCPLADAEVLSAVAHSESACGMRSRVQSAEYTESACRTRCIWHLDYVSATNIENTKYSRCSFGKFLRYE
jgi:hypothetical protein